MTLKLARRYSLALLVCALALNIFWSRSGNCQSQSNGQPPQATQDQKLSLWSSLIGRLPDPEINPGPCDQPQAKQDPGKCVEWISANATFQQAFWAERSFYAGLAGIGLVVGTFIASLWAAFAGHRAANAAEKALADLERPHVFLEIKPILVADEVGSHDRAFVEFSMSNFGRFPADVVECLAGVCQVAGKPYAGDLRDEFHRVVGPEKTEAGLRVQFAARHFLKFSHEESGEVERIEPVRAPEYDTYFVVDIRYNGLRDEPYHTACRWRWDHDVARWTSYGRTKRT